jgi:hypothetical protein
MAENESIATTRKPLFMTIPALSDRNAQAQKNVLSGNP